MTELGRKKGHKPEIAVAAGLGGVEDGGEEEDDEEEEEEDVVVRDGVGPRITKVAPASG